MNENGTIELEQPVGVEASDHDALVKCQYIGCDKPATLKMVRSNTCVCDEHYELNVLRFGCVMEVNPLDSSGT